MMWNQKAELYKKLGSEPMPGANPCGVNCRLEDSFEAIEAELAKLDSLGEVIPVKWKDIVTLSEQILSKESKDLLVACYLTRALCDADLLKGLMTGLQLNQLLITYFWSECFPPKKRFRGRVAAYEWLVAKTLPLLEATTPTKADLLQIKELQGIITTLGDALIEHLADNAPVLNDLTRHLKRWVASIEAEIASEEAKAKQPAQQAVTPQPAAAPRNVAPAATQTAPSGVTSDNDLQNLYRTCQENLRTVSQYLREQRLTDPESYRINRFLTWLGIHQLPPAQNGLTQLRPVSKEKMQGYAALYAEKKWHDLIPELENSVSRSPYWLDGHRMVAVALADMNANDAVDAVKHGVRDFLKRLPDVVNLTFSDKTPFADDETRSWITMDVMVEQGGGTAANLSLPIAAEGGGTQWEEAYQQACELMRDKRQSKALQLFQEGCARSLSVREQALWRYYQARFCYEYQQLNFAIPLLQNLDDQLLNKGIEDWEPGISTKVIELLLRCYKALGKKAPKERVESLHARLCRHDLALAVELSNH